MQTPSNPGDRPTQSTSESVFFEDDEPWQEKAVTEPQAGFLKSRGIEVPGTRGQASALIAKAKKAEALNPPLDIQARVEQLFNDGYLQTSRKFRGVARLPDGKTGIEALNEAELANVNLPSDHPSFAYWQDHYPKWASGMGELQAAKQYRACHAEKAGLYLTLDAATFEALRTYTIARGVDFSWGKL